MKLKMSVQLITNWTDYETDQINFINKRRCYFDNGQLQEDKKSAMDYYVC